MTEYYSTVAPSQPHPELAVANIALAIHLARKFCRHARDYDDLQSEAYVALCIAAKEYRSDGGAAFSTYAYTVISNRLMGWNRRSSRKPTAVELTDSLAGWLVKEEVRRESLSAASPSGWSADDVTRVIASLKRPRDRELLRQRLAGLTFAQIAESSGVTRQAISLRWIRLKSFLQARG
jgi:RNA polymerase sigma factor (sigma-70 family)